MSQPRLRMVNWLAQDDPASECQTWNSILGLGPKGQSPCSFYSISPSLSIVKRNFQSTLTPLHLIILHFQMFPVGISSKHTSPLVNAFGPPSPEFVQQGTFTIKMFSILSWLKRPSHHWVGKGRDVILTAVPRCSLPSSTQLSRSPPSTVTIWFFLLTPERIECIQLQLLFIFS